MRVLVTGSAGFIGEAVVEVLGERHRVRGFDVRETPKAHESGAHSHSVVDSVLC